MSKTVFTKVDYDLGTLVSNIKMGDIGLPDIQRPFVWSNTKVKDLFDSMYRGYPVGYLLFWQNSLTGSVRTIGTDHKQKVPRLVIVDGQQRLTSLYAVIKNIPVFREDFKCEKIQIAFNPLHEVFEVADAANCRDPLFIPDISILWASESSIIKVIRNYMENLRKSLELSEEQEKQCEETILRLQGLLGYPFTALELIAEIDEAAVSEVFVRINSKGTPLNQADFILTLMSVFWDEGRTALESFCRESRTPAKGKSSPFNYFIDPSPDQLLRVCVGVAFKRAQLKYVYSILRGKDLKTGKTDDERRDQQFAILKDAQERVLNLTYWHDFMNCVRQAGFRSGKMISSQNNLLFSYVLYLIGRTEYQIPDFELRRMIARWFFMSSVTRRFTDSPESAMEFDLARLREVNTGEEFLKTLGHICDITLTNDFWSLALPNDLATSSPRSPSLFAYQAALVLLDAKALFSKLKIDMLLDPSVTAVRSAVEQHHLFPKSYLNKQGISGTRDTNQIANFTLIEWGDNNDISDLPPVEYLPVMRTHVGKAELERMYHWHALPLNWEQLDYKDFLEKRRELIALVIAEGYSSLMSGEIDESEATVAFDLSQAVMNGESEAVEFKCTIRTNLHTNSKDPRMELAILKTLAGFLNNNGGTLVVGVTDDGSPVGLDADGFENEDKMALHLVNIIKARLGIPAMTNVHAHFDEYKGSRVLVVKCRKAPTPVFVVDGDAERFYIRTGPSTTELSASQTHDYIKQRFGGNT
jgi:hypothetical protein